MPGEKLVEPRSGMIGDAGEREIEVQLAMTLKQLHTVV
jgi:hypothetical protein